MAIAYNGGVSGTQEYFLSPGTQVLTASQTTPKSQPSSPPIAYPLPYIVNNKPTITAAELAIVGGLAGTAILYFVLRHRQK